jgi:tetratricopeptide (TPR) repeat protein
LVPLALHERFADANYLEAMTKAAGSSYQREQIDQLLANLENAGLLQHYGQAVYAMHPALSGFLRSRIALQEAMHEPWRRAFVEVMAGLANHLAPKPLHEKRSAFYWHGANFHTALRESERLSMDGDYAALVQSLVIYAQKRREFISARHYFERLAEHHKVRSHAEGEAAAYHQLGMIAEEQSDFKRAEQWYLKSLAIWEIHGDERGAALTRGQLGHLALAQGRVLDAGRCFVEVITVFLRHNDPHSAQIGVDNFVIAYQNAPPDDKAELKKLWDEARLGPMPVDE